MTQSNYGATIMTSMDGAGSNLSEVHEDEAPEHNYNN